MIQSKLRHSPRSNPYRKRINREPSPLLANSVPYASILLASLIPILFVSTTGAIVPPLGFMLLVGWRLMRPGLLPSWAGLPLGAFDDLFSGQPFGSAILLWSLTMLVIEWVESRFPWRGFWQDWAAAAIALGIYIPAALIFSGARLSGPLIGATLPQLVVSLMLFPVIAGLVGSLDRLRLLRIREVR